MNIPGLDERIRITKRLRKGEYEVMFPVSYKWNGGREDIVDPPIQAPPGYRFVDICVGLQMNSRPPLDTKLMVKDE